jgi:hypothetical protein
MKKPVLWVQKLDNKNKLAFDFCYHAKLGAELNGIKVKTFTDSMIAPNDPYNIIVGSVEQCAQWLDAYFDLPQLIDPSLFSDFLGRNSKIKHISEIDISKGKVFIKPAEKIKAFTGFVAWDNLSLKLFSENYEGNVIVQDVIEIESEYRLYISEKRVIGMKHYSGDCLLFPDASFIDACVELSFKKLDYHSYTLDFGVLENGRTVLIEANDGFAIGNYGLDCHSYYQFVKNRWLQLTKLRK